MLFEWLGREGWIIANYWLLSTAFGLTAMPLLLRLLPSLPDRGYTLARAAGTLLIVVLFWLMAVLGFVDNSTGSIMLAWLVVGVLALAVYFRSDDQSFDLRTWWQDNRRVVVVAEILFIVLLVGFATFRAYQNEMTSTEKPMDLAFMSAIQHSESFPPNDPWLSGYAISYYYLGYVVSAVNAMSVGVASTTGYGMHLALLFALSGVAAFGVTYNLVEARSRKREDEEPPPETIDDDPDISSYAIEPKRPRQRTSIGFGLLGMAFVLFLGSFHMVLIELPYRNGWFGDEYLRFWDGKDRDAEPSVVLDLLDPADRGGNFFWYFAHARTITERSVGGSLDVGDYYNGALLTEPFTVESARVREVIDEFPAFSFVLGDSHPHVMALPFVLLVIGLILNLILSPTRPTPSQVLFYGVCVGALVFLNTWDAPIYLVVMVGAEGVRRLAKNSRLHPMDILELMAFALMLTVIMLVVYGPFLLGFRSQLGGILPNVLFPTRPQQLFVFFGPFVVLLSGYLIFELWHRRRNQVLNWAFGGLFASFVLFALVLMAALLVQNGVISGEYQRTINTFIPPPTEQFDSVRGDSWAWLNGEIFGRRLQTLLTPLVILLGLASVVAYLLPRPRIGIAEPRENRSYPVTTGFVFLLVGASLGLVLIPEFIYLRDNFTWRMNTVFKFYYQVWIMLAIASAFAVYRLTSVHVRPVAVMPVRVAQLGLAGLVLAVGMLYFPTAIYWRMFIEPERVYAEVISTETNEDGTITVETELRTRLIDPTLDGGRGFTALVDYQAIMCLQDYIGDEQVTVAEANPYRAEDRGVAINYNPNHARTGSLTGIPVILGWPGHQGQWRGTGAETAIGTRPQDLDLLFSASRLEQVEEVINQYGIDYILFGSVERAYYGSDGEQKFIDNYQLVCDENINGSAARVYRVTDVLAAEELEALISGES